MLTNLLPGWLRVPIESRRGGTGGRDRFFFWGWPYGVVNLSSMSVIEVRPKCCGCCLPLARHITQNIT
jgi:hypothetical protein